MFNFITSLLIFLSVSSPTTSQTIQSGCWPENIVFYEIDKNYAQELTHLVQDRMRHISDKTCIRFVNRNDHSFNPIKETPLKYLSFQWSTDNYCWVTRTDGNRTTVMTIKLASVCLSKRTILHEMMHTLGFRHEHQRVDRDCYVLVFPSEVSENPAFKIDWYNSDNEWIQRSPYDKNSVMHYKNGINIRSRVYLWFEWEPLGNINGDLTKLDVWKINYKHCGAPHFCDLHPGECADMERKKSTLPRCKRKIIPDIL